MAGRWRQGVIASLATATVVGTAVGVGGYAFLYAKGASYLGSDPAACANCHIMRAQYDGWTKSSHHAVAGCNDCHTPAGFFGKWWTKAQNGFWHSFYFTTQSFHEPIQITERNRRITEERCRGCHAAFVAGIVHGEGMSCIRCHDSVGHQHGD